jgi:hypothetical protein
LHHGALCSLDLDSNAPGAPEQIKSLMSFLGSAPLVRTARN